MMEAPSSEAQDDQVKWLSTLRDLEDEISVTEQHIESNVKSNDDYKEAYIHAVDSYRDNLIARLDQLVAKAKHEGMSIHKRNDDTLKQLAKTCKETKDTIEEQKTIARELSQKKQPRQLYVILRTGLQDMRSVIKQSSFHNPIEEFTFENNSKVQYFLQNDIHEIGTLQEMCKGSDEVVDGTHSLSNFSPLMSKIPPPLPPKPVVNQMKTLQRPYNDASSTLDPLHGKEWFHGDISRQDAATLLKEMGQDGTFLVRKSTQSGGDHPYTLVVLFQNHVYNLKVRLLDDRQVALGEYKEGELNFKDVPLLIDHHKRNKIYLVNETEQKKHQTFLKKFPVAIEGIDK